MTPDIGSAENEAWLDALPQAFRAYLGGRRLEEVECIVPDFVGMSRGKAMPSYKFSPEGAISLPVSIFYQAVNGDDVDMPIENQWAEADMVVRPDIATACAVPWAEDPTLQVIHDCHTRSGAPVAYAPRNVLKRVLARYAERGWRPVVAPELEFYLIKPNPNPIDLVEPPVGRSGRIGPARRPYSMVAVDEYAAVIDTIYDFAEKQGLPIDSLIQEDGAGQMEINLPHGDALTLADQVFLFKRTIREAALKNGIFATFMAKPMRDQPGSAMHLHQSVLESATGRNLFSDPDGAASPLFLNFVGGAQLYMMDAMPLVAPYVNSYRRFEAFSGGSAPTNLAWGNDNRATGLRAPVARPENRRIENRVIGMDCNPYIAIATSLATGLLGIENAITPDAPELGTSEDGERSLPQSFDVALTRFEEAHELRAMLGDDFCMMFEAIKRQELWAFHREISPWEREHLLLNV
ncbi:MAG: glutamine synthetase family protein [Pseudomonadota bacterium]